MKPNLLKNFVLWTSKINLSYIPHIHVVNHYYSFNQYTDYPVNIAQKDDFNIIIPKTQGSMHIFSFAEMNNEGYYFIVCQSEHINLCYQHSVPESQCALDCQ